MSEIDRLYYRLGGPDGYLGSPTGDEQSASAGHARIRFFSGGTILWLPETGPLAHPGDIYWIPFPKEFTVFQQNMALLPPLQLPNGNNLYRGHEREAAIERLISFLEDATPDIVGLSEMWVSEERRNLLEYLQDLYPYSLVGPGQFVDQSLDGGLLLLSQLPFQDKSASIFPQCLGEDCFSQKGILHGRISLPMQDTSFDLFLTHLQNPTPFLQSPNRGIGANGVEKVLAQIDHLATFVRDNRDSLAPALIIGDLNVDGFAVKGYEDLLTRLDKPIDLLSGKVCEIWSDAAGDFARIRVPKAVTFDARNTFAHGKRLDYFLSFPGNRVYPVYGSAKIVRLESSSGRDISDHYGILAELTGLIHFQ